MSDKEQELVLSLDDNSKEQEEAKNDLLELASIGVDEFAKQAVKKSKKKHEKRAS